MKNHRSPAPRWLAPLVVIAACSLGVATRAARAETLSAEEAVGRAASRNPTLRAALLDLAAARHAAAAEEGARRPTLVASVDGQYGESMGSFGATPIRTEAKSVGSSVAVRYTTDAGTSLEVGASADASWRSQTSAAGASTSSGPNYSATGYVTARQPLLRGAGNDTILAPYAQAQASADAAASQGEVTASQTALDVLGAYWELWYAEQAVAVQEQALAAAQRQLADARARAETLGTGSRVDVLQFATSAASIADTLSQARATRATRALELGRLLGMSPDEAASLRASGAPAAASGLPSASAVAQAVAARSPELAALRADIVAARSRVAAAADADQPRLDAFATASAGTLWASSGGAGLALIGGRPAFSVVGGLELELPFGGGRASADASRARVQLAAAEARYQARVDAIEAQASALLVALEAAAQQVELASETARMAAELVAAERQRLLLGTTTSAEVVRVEQTLREAELRRLRAVVSQATSRFQLEHATGALLDRFASLRGRSS